MLAAVQLKREHAFGLTPLERIENHGERRLVQAGAPVRRLLGFDGVAIGHAQHDSQTHDRRVAGGITEAAKQCCQVIQSGPLPHRSGSPIVAFQDQDGVPQRGLPPQAIDVVSVPEHDHHHQSQPQQRHGPEQFETQGVAPKRVSGRGTACAAPLVPTLRLGSTTTM